MKKRITSRVLDDLATTNAFVLKGKVVKPKLDTSGRPTVVTQQVVQKLEHAFAYDSTVEEACLYGGIARATYYNFVKEYPEFLDRIEQLREAAILVLRQTVLAKAEWDADTALKYLERKRRVEFSLRTEVAHSGEVVNRHAISPEAEKLIRSAMGNFATKLKALKKDA